MNLNEWLQQIRWLSSINITMIDIIQIIVLVFALYYLAKSLYKTRAWILVKGLLVIGAAYAVICVTQMTVLQLIMQGLFSTFVIAIVIMLQPELQKIVELIGQKKLAGIGDVLHKKGEGAVWYSERTIHELTLACEEMSKAKTGALIAIEKGIPLEEYINSGIKLNSVISRQLLLNIFEKNTPLHDGAVIITNDMVASATCYLPLSNNPDVDKSLGTRHRAALGLSEHADCVVIVVSEETGAISVCIDGKIRHDIGKLALTTFLEAEMHKNIDGSAEKKKKRKSPFWLKLLAPIVGVFIWLFVVVSNDPWISTTIRNVPVSILNAHVLDDAGQTYKIKSGSVVTVKASGRRSLIDQITKNDLSATADFSELSITYAVPINARAMGDYADVDVQIVGTDIMKLELEEMVKIEVPIEVKITGDVNTKYVVQLLKTEIPAIPVTCAQSLAKTLDKAIVTVDAYGKDKDFIVTATPVIYDKNGNVVDAQKITLSQDSIQVEMNVFEVKEIPFTVILSEQKVTADTYYVLNDYSAQTDTIRIGASEDVLDELQELVIPVTLDETSENANTFLINLKQYLPETVSLAKYQQEQISVVLDLTKYQKKTIPLSVDKIKSTGYDVNAVSVEIVNVPTSIVLHYDTSLTSLESLSLDTLHPTIKVEETEPGTYKSELVLTDIEGVVYAEDMVVEYVLKERTEE